MIRETTGQKKVMSANDQYSKPAPNNLRLSKLSSIPSADDLGFAMTLATNNPRNIVELPWKSAELPMQYTIKVTCALSLEEPRWMLHAGVGSEADGVIWNYDTPDYQLVFNLINEECEKALASLGNNGQSNYNQAPGNQQFQQQGGGYQQQGMQQPSPFGNLMQQDSSHQQGGMQQHQDPQPYVQDYGAPPFQPTRSAQNTQALPGQSTMPVVAVPAATGNALPSMAFGAAAASIAQPPPLVPPDTIAGQSATGSRRSVNLEKQQLSQQLVPLTPTNPQAIAEFSQAQQHEQYGAPQHGAAPFPQGEEQFGQQPQYDQQQQFGQQNNQQYDQQQQNQHQYDQQQQQHQYDQQHYDQQQQQQQYDQQQQQHNQNSYDQQQPQFGQPPQYDQQQYQQQYQQQHQQQQGSGQFGQPGQPVAPQQSNPFQQPGQQQQISQNGLTPAHAPGAGFEQQGNTVSQSPPAPYISSGVPEGMAPKPEMPSSRMFTLPQPGVVRNPAERLLDHATSAEEVPAAKPPRALPAPVKFDRTAVDSVFKMLTETELGFLNHGALMFFTVREFSRFQRNNVPFSIVLFELVINNNGAWEPMPQNLVKDVGKQLFGVMRPLDLIAHYEKDDYAMLLPHTTREDSFTVVQRLHEMLNSTAVAPGLAAGQAQIFCGISTIPDDCAHPGVAIAAALEAKSEAKLAGRPVLRFCDI
jgi:GGDEF domain-containing protein